MDSENNPQSLESCEQNWNLLLLPFLLNGAGLICSGIEVLLFMSDSQDSLKYKRLVDEVDNEEIEIMLYSILAVESNCAEGVYSVSLVTESKTYSFETNAQAIQALLVEAIEYAIKKSKESNELEQDNTFSPLDKLTSLILDNVLVPHHNIHLAKQEEEEMENNPTLAIAVDDESVDDSPGPSGALRNTLQFSNNLYKSFMVATNNVSNTVAHTVEVVGDNIEQKTDFPILKLMKHFGIRKLMAIVLFYVLSAIFYMHYENWNLSQTIYFLTVTIFTVGYGDIHPTNHSARIFTIFVIIIGFVCVLTEIQGFITYLVEYLERKSDEMVLESLKKATNNKSDSVVILMKGAKIQILNIIRAVFYMICIIYFGAIVVWRLERMKFSTALYFAVVTVSTVGYGDITIGDKTRIFLIFYIPLSVVGAAMSASRIVASLKEIDRELEKVASLTQVNKSYDVMLKKLSVESNQSNIPIVDLSISKVDFILELVLEKFPECKSDIDTWLKEFEEIDDNGDGTLSYEELLRIKNNNHVRALEVKATVDAYKAKHRTIYLNRKKMKHKSRHGTSDQEGEEGYNHTYSRYTSRLSPSNASPFSPDVFSTNSNNNTFMKTFTDGFMDRYNPSDSRYTPVQPSSHKNNVTTTANSTNNNDRNDVTSLDDILGVELVES